MPCSPGGAASWSFNADLNDDEQQQRRYQPSSIKAAAFDTAALLRVVLRHHQPSSIRAAALDTAALLRVELMSDAISRAPLELLHSTLQHYSVRSSCQTPSAELHQSCCIRHCSTAPCGAHVRRHQPSSIRAAALDTAALLRVELMSDAISRAPSELLHSTLQHCSLWSSCQTPSAELHQSCCTRHCSTAPCGAHVRRHQPSSIRAAALDIAALLRVELMSDAISRAPSELLHSTLQHCSLWSSCQTPSAELHQSCCTRHCSTAPCGAHVRRHQPSSIRAAALDIAALLRVELVSEEHKIAVVVSHDV